MNIFFKPIKVIVQDLKLYQVNLELLYLSVIIYGSYLTPKEPMPEGSRSTETL